VVSTATPFTSMASATGITPVALESSGMPIKTAAGTVNQS
jgi:hypothetical protein